jgi:hypothetical protein
MTTIIPDPERRRREREPPQASTFHQHAQSAANDTGGSRFGALGNPHIVGESAVPKYPQASEPFRVDPVGDEPPLSAYKNPAIEPSTSASVEATGAPAGATASSENLPRTQDESGDAGAPSFQDGDND